MLLSHLGLGLPGRKCSAVVDEDLNKRRKMVLVQYEGLLVMMPKVLKKEATVAK